MVKKTTTFKQNLKTIYEMIEKFKWLQGFNSKIFSTGRETSKFWVSFKRKGSNYFANAIENQRNWKLIWEKNWNK